MCSTQCFMQPLHRHAAVTRLRYGKQQRFQRPVKCGKANVTVGGAKALPGDATALLRAMPDHVSNFARVQADSTDAWADSNPIEEYKLTYSNGNDKDAVQLTVAQWSDSEKAQGQYTKLTGDLKGSSLANGVVKVNGDVTGNYEVKTAESDDTQATAVWRNDTVVFSVTGTKNSVVSVYQLFPL